MSTGTQSGFTVTELVVVVSIVAILMAIGAPSYKYVTTSNRISSEINGLLGDLQFARAEAIKEGQAVTVCTTTDGSTCSGNTTWSGGWLVYMGAAAPTANGTLRLQKPLSGGDTLNANNYSSAITFRREGFALGLPATITLTLKDSTANTSYTRCLQMSIVGAMTTEVHGQGAC